MTVFENIKYPLKIRKINEIYHTGTGLDLLLNIGIDLYVQKSYQSIESVNLYIGKKIWISFEANSVSFLRK